ncbi:hypothetical protein [Maribacter sp. 2307UL18-2]
MSTEKLIQPEQKVLENKLHRIQQQISAKYWFGWGGSYTSSKRK